jgi:tRNA(Ile)-lysidine synthase
VTDLLQHVEQNIQNRWLFKRRQKILIAVSGGLDSMALLHALRKISSRHQWKIAVAHFNHQLRGRSSDADEQLVRKTAAALKLPFTVGRADVKQFARESKFSIEMAARKLRHEFFARVARERKISTVALAHHADDQVELFFLRVLRGAGGEGLAGMKWRAPSPADSKITLVRPLLDLSKAGLHGFIREHKIHFREDATNAQLDATRNRIRNELLPLLRRNYQPGLGKTVLRLMEIVGAESDAIGSLAGDWLKQRRPDFEKLSVAVQRRVLQAQLVSLGLVVDFELVESLRQSADVLVNAGPKFFIVRDAEGKVSLQTHPSVIGFNPNELAVNLAGRAGEVVFDATRVSWKIDTSRHFKRSRGETGREFFDRDKIGNQITLRHWQPGDHFQPIGLKSAAKLQDLFTNAKIPRDRRRGLIVVTAAGGEIFWVEGLRISENFKLTPKTKRRLAWRWRRL